MYSKSIELEKFRSFNGPLIDVRSPSEYYKGHMPNSINIPLFDNNERSIIGTIYKKEGREKAVIEGLKFFEKKMELLLDNLFMSIDSYKTISNSTDFEGTSESEKNEIISDIFASINLPVTKAEKEIGIYKATITKMKQAKELLDELKIKDKKRNK